MLKDILQDCSLNNSIKLEFEDKIIEGLLIDFNEQRIKVKTENKIVVLSARVLENLLTYEIIECTSDKSKYDTKEIEIQEEPILEIKNVEDEKQDDKKEKVQESLPNTTYKVGDVIPLEELEKRIDKKHKPKFPKTKGKGILLSSLSDLKELILPEIEAENKKIVSANGTITKYFGDRNFGFLTDKFGYDIWFGFNSIIDDTLLQTLRGTVRRANIPVLFTLTKNYKGDSATHIHKPKTVEQVAELAKQYFDEEGKPDTALGLVEQILFSFPENFTAIKLKEEIEEKRFKQSTFKPAFKNNELNYQKAKKLHNIEKNYEEALKYYLLALKNNEKKESCIKDIAMLYVSMGETEKAIEFIMKYENELHKGITTYNYLENFYGSVKDFDKVLEYTELLLDEKSVLNDNRKNSMYLSKKGFALIQLDKLEEAREVLEEAISIHPENTYANRLLQALEEANISGDFKLFNQLLESTNALSFYGGFSSYIQTTLNQSDYYGLKESIKLKGVFTSEHLSQLREDSKKVTEGKPRERAEYLLTEAKLIQEIEPEKDEEIRSVLARYCNAMGISAIYDNFPVDVVRFYYFESFNLEDKWDSIIRQFIIYLESYSKTFPELRRITAREIRDLFTEVFPKSIRYLHNNNPYIYEELLTLFVSNTTISEKVTQAIYNDKNALNAIINYFKIKNNNISSFELFYKQVNILREKRQQDIYKWFAINKAIISNENLENLVNVLHNSLQTNRTAWLPQLDLFRLNTIFNDVYESLNQYLRESGYRDKEGSYKVSKAQINQLINEIKDKPTKFSYEGFIPLLEKIELLLDKSFKTVEAASSPTVNISILGEANVLGKDNVVPFQVKMETSKNSSPIRNLKIIVQNTNEITFFEKDNEYFDSIDGGESHIFNLLVKVSLKVANEKATSLNVTCFYSNRTGDEPIKIDKQLSLRLYSESEFVIIPNPYEKLANGGPVTGRSMFYGRNEFIDRITEAIISTESKQVVIYGQKRSGKSSVLYHLKKSLEDTQKTFCISFSIGEIFENISSATFFHKILFTIEEELEKLAFNGIEVPTFKCPLYTELKDAPNSADIFRKYLRNFKRNCQNISNWQDKKLVVMIDEFTYLYTAIKESRVSDAIMKQWKAITQNEDATFSAVLVGQDVFPLFKSEFPNEFGVTQDERLTYLSKRDALKLIEEPVWNTKSNKSRYLEDAAEKIIEYTSCNPFYIQIFCARLIKEMNDKKFIEATRSDIKPVADSFLFGGQAGQALSKDKFDNLLTAGEKHDIQRIPQEHSKAVLKKIAEATKFVPYCSREDINIGNKEYEDLILDDLKNREVIEQQGNNYKIQVKLFQEWLLKN